jgi:3'-phosphoadenosine 5'-phosphosulfate sulfotransferase (PAPS reductase)/FAD synthetase
MTSDGQTRLTPGLDPDDLIQQAKERWRPIKTYCLFSGGNDSAGLAHRCADQYDALVFADTGTALPRPEVSKDLKVYGVEEFVRSFAERIGRPLIIKRSGDAYRTMVIGDSRWWKRYRQGGKGLTLEQFRDRDETTYGIKEGTVRSGPHKGFDLGYFPWGFPGVGYHSKTFARLKERRFEEVLREAKVGHPRTASVLFLSGIRRAESRNRAGYEPLTDRGSIKYCNPLIDWDGVQMDDYRKENGIPSSDVAQLLHRSGECNCAAGGSWYRERDLIKAFWPRWFKDNIEALEQEAEALGIRWCRWGGFDLEGNRAKRSGEETPDLCRRCVGDDQLELAA